MTRETEKLRAEIESVKGTASCLRAAADQLEAMSVRLLADAEGLLERLAKVERTLGTLDGYGGD